ncbi:MAG: Rpn family recombination-promoting nuclease/putative transposase, partial [Lachnospiraceae bacterium]|nr:Rpn family recombination-promoting nuclease/putative transposase [Lachnospiraceae bacterium]
DIQIIGEPHSQAARSELDVELNNIVFDVFAESTDHRYFTADMQRRYRPLRQERRHIYYACRAISTQPVLKMMYEKVKPVNILFVFTDNHLSQTIRHIKLCDVETHEVFDDLLEMTLVHLPAVLRIREPSDELYLFAKFFMIESQEDADAFTDMYETDETGRRLVSMYNTAVNNVANLQGIENAPYYKGRLSETEMAEAVKESVEAVLERARAEARREGKKEGKKEGREEGMKEGMKAFAVSLFGILDDEIIAEKSGLSLEELQHLKR